MIFVFYICFIVFLSLFSLFSSPHLLSFPSFVSSSRLIRSIHCTISRRSIRQIKLACGRDAFSSLSVSFFFLSVPFLFHRSMCVGLTLSSPCHSLDICSIMINHVRSFIHQCSRNVFDSFISNVCDRSSLDLVADFLLPAPLRLLDLLILCD